MRNHRTKALTALLISSLSFHTWAGTKIVMQSAETGDKLSDSTMLIQGEMLRMTHFDKSDQSDSDVIFNHKNQTLMIISPQDNSYTEFKATDLDTLKAKMDQVKQQMEAQLAKMPAEQQKMMREMMAGKMGIGKPKKGPVKKLVKTGKTDSTAGYTCKYVEVLSDGVKKRELCVTEWSKFENSQEVKSAMLGMMQFFKKLTDSIGQFSGDQDTPFSEIEELGGFPIIYKEFDQGEVTERAKLKSINQESFDSQQFAPPKGFKKQSMKDIMP